MVAQEEAQEEQGRRRKKKIITCVDGVNEYEEMNGHWERIDEERVSQKKIREIQEELTDPEEN